MAALRSKGQSGYRKIVVVKGTYAHVCAALRVSVSQRSHKLFLDATPSRLPGDGRADQRKTQKSKFAKIEISNLQNRQNQNSKNFRSKMYFRKIAPEICSCSPISPDFGFFVPLRAVRNARGVYLIGANSVPMKRRYSTWLNSHGSEERTWEDTMNPANEALVDLG
jgi:hypothetical protein